jgi:hypothetical protein
MQGGKEDKGRGTKKVFLSPRKHTNIPKRATDIDDVQRDILHRTDLEYYGKGELCQKSNTHS